MDRAPGLHRTPLGLALAAWALALVLSSCGDGGASSAVDTAFGADAAPDLSAPKGDDPDPAVADVACLGPSLPLVRARSLPFVAITLGGARGWFLVDLATTASTIDPEGFEGGTPEPMPGTTDRYEGFQLFGGWAPVTLARQEYAGLDLPLRQAGILGTDFLSLHVYTLYLPPADPSEASELVAPLRAALGDEPRLFRAPPANLPGDGGFCSDGQLAALGLAAASMAGWYASDPSGLPAGHPNVPTLPLEVAGVRVPAQMDTGFDDALVPFSVNVNEAFFDLLPSGAVVSEPSLDLALSTCVPGVVESVAAYRPVAAPRVYPGAHAVDQAVLFLKSSPPAAAVCGGIGTWSTPAAQLGASYAVRLGLLVLDPFTARAWAPAGGLP